MAWYYGTFNCGHEGRVNITGPTKDRQRKSDWIFENCMCEECKKKAWEKEKEESLAEAKEKSVGLPELEGTEKQVNWALQIRQKFVDAEVSKYAEEKEEIIQEHTLASWWIDKRFENVQDMCTIHFREKQINKNVYFKYENLRKEILIGEVKKRKDKEKYKIIYANSILERAITCTVSSEIKKLIGEMEYASFTKEEYIEKLAILLDVGYGIVVPAELLDEIKEKSDEVREKRIKEEEEAKRKAEEERKIKEEEEKIRLQKELEEKEKNAWRTMRINGNNIETWSDRSVLINMPNNSEYKNYKFWISKNLIEQVGSRENYKIKYKRSMEVTVFKNSNSIYKKFERIDERKIGIQEVEEAFEPLQFEYSSSKESELHIPEKKEPVNIEALEELRDDE